MNALVPLFALAAGLAALVAAELRPQQAASSEPVIARSQPSASGAPPAPLEADPASFVAPLLARPLFTQSRRPSDSPSPATAAASATSLPRMTGILIDGTRRRAIFASQGGKPTIVSEGGRIGPFTVQTIEPQEVVVLGPEGKRTVRTSFDPDLQPSPAPTPAGLGLPQFPGIVLQPGLPLTLPPAAPRAGYGAAR